MGKRKDQAAYIAHLEMQVKSLEAELKDYREEDKEPIPAKAKRETRPSKAATVDMQTR